LVTGQGPDWVSLWPVALLGMLLCIWGLRLFRRHAGEMVDEL
jgi:lipopolysaccharide transport system permease protein